jgi:16S rRNA (uracil1498-N3)-methyltransferase
LHVIGQESPRRELPFRTEVAAPLPKGDRGQFLLEKLTELGVAGFVPLRTERSIVHPGETRLEKLQRYVIEASKQCGRNVLMQVAPVTDWTEYCRQENLPPTRFFAHPGAVGDHGIAPACPNQDLTLAVGPEGGFTDTEVKAAQEHQWRLITLGPRILRIETAALALAASYSLKTNESPGERGA